MSKWVRLENNIIREIIPDAATIPSVAHWYGDEFAAECFDAPDEAEQGWMLDPETGAFHSPAPPPEPEPEQPDTASMALSLASILFVLEAQSEASRLDDAVIIEHSATFPKWDEHWTGKAGSIVSDGGTLYRSIHNVGAGQNTRPSATPSMWTRIGDPAEEWPVWVQPLGVHDAYNVGDKVSHAEKRWISTADGNIWQPGVYGWSEQK